jgi:hypothetical protein
LAASVAPTGGRPDEATEALADLLARLRSFASDAATPSAGLTERLPSRGSAFAAPVERRVMASPELLEAVQEEQRRGLRKLLDGHFDEQPPAWRQGLLRHATRTIDRLTIEIVGMLFDQLLRDRQVPAPIKDLLSCLQIPYLKAALMNADLLADSGNSARRLIDRIAATAVGWEPYGDENIRYRAQVEHIVRAVLDGFDRDMAIFERLTAEFNHFISELAERQSGPIARAKRAMEDAERREVLVINTTIQVRRAFEKVELEPYLRDFLVRPWVQVLVNGLMREESTPGYSKAFRSAIQDLVWSVQPKKSAEEKKQLVTVIPPMLRVLRDGLASIAMPEEEQSRFFMSLMQSHAQAVRPVDRATHARSARAAQEARERIENMHVSDEYPITTVAGGINVPDEDLMRAAQAHRTEVLVPDVPTDLTPLASSDDDEMERRIAAWQRGTWFEFWNDEKYIRVRLLWISPLRTLYMFAATGEAAARVLAPDVLKSYLKRGLLKPLEIDPLMQRAADGVVGELERSPRRMADLAARAVAPDK